MQKFLIIQTAFIGDVVLATCLIEKLHHFYPDAQIDFLLRKGNESLLKNYPGLHEVFIWDKKKNKWSHLLELLIRIRRGKYDRVINVQRFASTGFLTAFSGAGITIGFDKNPLSMLFTRKIKHRIEVKDGVHEIQRNLALIQDFTDDTIVKPRLFPSDKDFKMVLPYKQNNYITISPASVWFTKQYPASQWIRFINSIAPSCQVYLLGAPSDRSLCEAIRQTATHSSITNLSGELSFLQSAALMKDARMNYVNDSAPMHFASAMNAPVTAVFCSTIPEFGFGPLSDIRFIVQISQPLECRPCGLHGFKACPRGHFNCAHHITKEQLLQTSS